MATDSSHRSVGAVVNRLAALCSILVSVAVLAAAGIASWMNTASNVWIVGTAVVVASSVTFVGIRRLLAPRLALAEESADSVTEHADHLKKIENYRQEFLGDVSHELQTPIFAVQGFAETLLDGALEDPAVNRPFVEKILRHSVRLSALVNDLSHISQIETGSVKMNLLPFDPSSLVDDAEESLEMAAETAGVTLSKFATPNLRFAIGDRPRIRQVLDNLISNGIKYNDVGGRVEITVRMSDTGKVLFAVTDDGIGLLDEHFERITERFYRVDKSRSRERGGTGLGLAIVKHILEAHGTRLTINSRIGRGSTFSFELDSTDGPA